MRSIAFARPLLAPILLAVLGACAAGSAHDDAAFDVVADGSDFTMQPGTQVLLSDHGSLRYLRVLEDSRCKPDVQCIWAGDAQVAFRWTPAGATALDFILHTGKEPKEQALGGRRLTLVSLSPGATPTATLRIGHVGSP
jgi:hypothetical protein